MHTTDQDGVAKIQLTATYKGKTVTQTIDVIVSSVEIPDTISVKEAIETADDTIVTVRGVVMSSVVVQTAFYLNDGTGVIAVRTDSATIKEITIGNEIVVQGTRAHVKKDGSSNVGQSCIDNATLIVNLMGNHEYSKAPFITDKTFDEILGYSNDQGTIDRSTNVFVAECTLTKVSTNFYTNYYLSNSDNTSKYLLYASNGKTQYGAFDGFVNKTITVTFLLCDWNSKNYYAACLVSATDGETTILNDYNFR
jgi:uncharacterized protein YdeI (BOF family)